MSAIDFVVRDGAGSFDRGSVVPGAQPSVVLARGSDISLNLYPGQIAGYGRQGQALVITLANGEVLVLEGFFDAAGNPTSQLYVSAGGELYGVELVAGQGGQVFANYENGGDFGKFNPDDAFFFLRGPELLVAEGAVVEDDAVGMLANPLLGAFGAIGPLGWGAGAAGAAVLGSTFTRDDDGRTSSNTDTNPDTGDTDGDGDGDGGDGGSDGGDGGSGDGGDGGSGGGGGGDGGDGDGPDGPGPGPDDPEDPDGPNEPETPVPPTVTIREGTQSAGHVVNDDDRRDGVTIGGTGTPGGTIEVTLGNGSTQTGTVDENGDWQVVFGPDDVPPGEYSDSVTVIITNEGGTGSDSDFLDVDTETFVTFDAEATEGDGKVSAVEAADGVILSGTTEAGASVVVTVYGKQYTATVTGESWTAFVPAEDVTPGEYNLEVSVTATDAVGNTANTSGTVLVDTETFVTVNTAIIGGDGTVNRVERAAEPRVTGTAEAGATVVVTMGAASKTVVADQNGNWITQFARAEIPGGTYETTVTATATDALGNTAFASGTVNIDTELSVAFDTTPLEGDNIVNAAERADGVVLTGTTDPGSTVIVQMGGHSVTATVAASGAWSAAFPASALPQGETTIQATANATDPAGNTASATRSVVVDTTTFVTVETATVEGDGIINREERADGFVLTGTAEAGAVVEVSVEDYTVTTVADSSGNWSAQFRRADAPLGESIRAVSATATDIAGNTATATGTIRVDTLVNRLELDGPVTADNTLNALEVAAGVTLTGKVEEGSTLFVTLQNTRKEATVDADGNWTVDFGPEALRTGEYTGRIRMEATDIAGNTRTEDHFFQVDTIAPEVPVATSVDIGRDGSLRSFGISEADENLEVTRIDANGSRTKLSVDPEVDTRHNEIDLYFDTPVSDGSQLVISSTDLAGNQNATLFVLGDRGTKVVDVNNPGFDAFDIGAIDLKFVDWSELTLTAADLESLSRNDNTLKIHGGADDTVTLVGGASLIGSEDGYSIYTLGTEGGRVLIEEDINVIT
ncbi:Ig-like domain-containing protein [Histidinibacterium lentulum]|uniref:BapA prefix-like domain-containing protein n=1 Tax=Histidinibacterium lentulum TaxID=2480588 RepID=A0A3N2QYM3_9RHOB|nr:Ig-like domain-containing protein [Histidinibacterium lentulum]ROU00300.1 BapA prefix-like domain-containing protein [Histidinibacterium lentulum]